MKTLATALAVIALGFVTTVYAAGVDRTLATGESYTLSCDTGAKPAVKVKRAGRHDPYVATVSC